MSRPPVSRSRQNESEDLRKHKLSAIENRKHKIPEILGLIFAWGIMGGFGTHRIVRFRRPRCRIGSFLNQAKIEVGLPLTGKEAGR